MTYIRSDEADIYFSVSHNGKVKKYGDCWTTYSGGGLTASNSKTRPGGMGKERDVGGPASRGDVTLEIELDDQVVGWNDELENLVGRHDLIAYATVQYLNPDSSVLKGAKFTRQGTIKQASLPDTKNDSGDVPMFTVVIGCHENAA